MGGPGSGPRKGHSSFKNVAKKMNNPLMARMRRVNAILVKTGRKTLRGTGAGHGPFRTKGVHISNPRGW